MSPQKSLIDSYDGIIRIRFMGRSHYCPGNRHIYLSRRVFGLSVQYNLPLSLFRKLPAVYS